VSRHAAIDVGSNSIRLLIADVDALGRIAPVHVDREVVRLGTGVFRNGRLGAAATELASVVLARMAVATARHGATSVRAVGTSALRDASNADEFVLRASRILGCPLEVVGGLEEARLVQRGVAAHWPHEHEQVLIIDVGGGSVQLILSDRERFAAGTSLPLGAVRLTEMFLSEDPPSPGDVVRMRRHVREQIAAAADRLTRAAVHRVVATSATAGAIVCAVHGIKRSQRRHADRLGATAQQVGELLDMLVARNLNGRASIVGIGRRRAEIIVAGVATLDGVLCGLRLPKLQYSTAGVRDGIISDLAFRVCGFGQSAEPALQTRNTNVT